MPLTLGDFLGSAHEGYGGGTWPEGLGWEWQRAGPGASCCARGPDPGAFVHRAWGVRAMEPLEKDNQLMGLLVAPKVAAAPWEGEQGQGRGALQGSTWMMRP